MGTEWEERLLEDTLDALIDYRGKTPPKTTSGVRLITAKVIKDGRILDEKPEFIAADYYDTWMRRGLPEQGDVLLTTEAPLGEVAVIRETDRVALAQRVILLRPKQQLLDNRFLFYLLRSEKLQGRLRQRASGTTVLGIKQSELRKVMVPLPPLETQKKIAGILSAYDDLIENNLRRIRILEEMARALYREWFVYFRFPGHEEAKFVDSSMGRIPAGWEVKKVGEVCEVQSGFAFKSKDFSQAGRYSVITIKHVHETEFKPADAPRSDVVPGNMPKHCWLKEGDILLSLTGNIGRVCQVYGENYLLNQRVAKLVPKSPEWTGFTYLLFLDPGMKAAMHQLANGVAQQNLSPVQTAKIPILIPKDTLAKKFEEVVSPMLQLVLQIRTTNERLAHYRDAHLPQLMAARLVA